MDVRVGTIKKAEHRRIDAFELWCWRKLLRVPWTARRSNQSILKEISVHWKDWCWNWNSNTLATWCKELTHLKRPWCWEQLRAGGEGENRRWDSYMASPNRWTWVSVDSGSWWWTGRPGVLRFMGSQRVDTTEQLNWAEVTSVLVRPQGLQHVRLPFPLLSPRVCSNSYLLSQWCHPSISPSVAPFSFCLQSFPASESLTVSWLFTSGGPSIGASPSESVLSMNIQGWFPSGLTADSHWLSTARHYYSWETCHVTLVEDLLK